MITVVTCLLSYRHSSFTQRAYLCWRHTYCQWQIIELAMNVSPKNKTSWPFFTSWKTHMHMNVASGRFYHVAVPTENGLDSQRSIFRKNRLNFRPSSVAEKVSIICGTNKHVKSEMLSNRHTHTHTDRHTDTHADTQTKYRNTRCACTPRVIYRTN